MALPLMWIVLGCLGLTHGNPGLRKVPKVYNALVTTDQNLAPSRAYPVIQPVVHRTAIGYVPPYYYSQVGPNYESVYSTYGGYGGPIPGPEPEPIPIPRPTSNSDVTDNPDVESININSNIENESSEKEVREECEEKPMNNEEKKENKEQVPLSFYPNYRSMYYDPYFYGYNPYPQVPIGAPGTYYVDYQPRGQIFPGQIPTGSQPYPGPPSPSRNPEEIDNKEKSAQIIPAQEKKDKIPDVPPPPVPNTKGSRKSS